MQAGIVVRNPELVDSPTLLNRAETEMEAAAADTQWTMNFSLAENGIYHLEPCARATAIGEKLDICRGYPVSKGYHILLLLSG